MLMLIYSSNGLLCFYLDKITDFLTDFATSINNLTVTSIISVKRLEEIKIPALKKKNVI